MKVNKSKLFGFSKDFVLNILASLLSTGIMQLILYPQLAKVLSADNYGTLLTIMGYVNVVTLAFGNNLCNARLLQQKKYEEIGKNGDFQILVLFSSILSAISIFIICYVQDLGGIITLLGVSTATLLLTLKGYYLVAYRLEINYLKNLLANVVLAIGYIVGAYLLIRFVDWPWVFVFSTFVCLLFIFFTSKIFKESFSKTVLFKSSLKLVVILLFSGLIANSTTYLDRFIIHPILGGEAVSTYATAAFFSKTINLVLAPIVSVLLNYFTMGKIAFNKKTFFLLNAVFLAGGALFFLASITIGPWMTGLLYPSLIDSAREYILAVSLGLIIGIVGNFASVFALVKAPSYWQIVLSAFKFVLYLLLGIILVNMYGIWGMCIAVFITNLCFYVFSFLVAYMYIRKNNKIENEELGGEIS